jgi:hypothetical protein
MKSLSMSAVVKAWGAWDAELRPYTAHDGEAVPHMRTLLEPLHVTAPPDARPYCYGVGEIDFYDADRKRVICKTRSHDLTASYPTVIKADGIWWEIVGSGQVVYIDGEWVIRRELSNATKWAKVFNGGQS